MPTLTAHSAYLFMSTRLTALKKLLVLSLFALLLSACDKAAVPIKAQFLVFGTQVDITIYHSDKQTANQAIHQVEQRFQQFHKAWHAWEKGGIVSKINQAIQQRQSIVVDNSVKQFIIKSQQLCQQSQGLFDPGIGSLIALWGFHSDKWQGPPPAKQQINNWLAQSPSILDIHFNGQRLVSDNPYVSLDFGGNAKGLAIDIALETLQNHGIEHALVSIGGDMKALGEKDLEHKQPWQIAIQDPKNPSRAIASLSLQGGESVVTSGTYQRYFDWQDQRYSHILNPKTGYPAQSFASVTVIFSDATSADSAATALLVAGPEHWQEIAQSMAITKVFAITQEGKIIQTKAMAQRVKLL
ncbi:FAD:protein FMN transferase [Thiomicrorhabdus sediminis]|uniref:FAD:protein FMN transferase n=1 Tax=Thiomicrorhabdus sediminis TaxID=2580412 RepID=A0A4P9K6Z0_9GAMM|nr:FAD:protein FMN transferase [Thiomicrorhabdus sediminis]QCU90835.1 FAD:protein FMN transferase [Thiomicrorhabdus sediminis]